MKYWSSLHIIILYEFNYPLPFRTMFFFLLLTDLDVDLDMTVMQGMDKLQVMRQVTGVPLLLPA